MSRDSQSDPQSNSSQFSNTSSNTFLAVPRNLVPVDQEPIVQQYIQRHVSFQNPQSLQKSEHKESIEEQDLFPSKLSHEKRSIYEKNSHGLSLNQQSYHSENREEDYRRLKLFQIEMEKIVQRGNFRLSRTRRSSEIFQTPKQNHMHSQISKDSFRISPQFKIDKKSREVSDIDLTQKIYNIADGSSNNLQYQILSNRQSPPYNKFITPYRQASKSLRYWNGPMISVIMFITKAVTILNKNRLNLFTKKYFKLIGDKSSSYRYFKSFSQIREISQKSALVNNWLKSSRYTFDPCDIVRLIWIIFMTIVDSLMMMLITYTICFSDDTWWLPMYIGVVFIDSLIFLNTAIYVDGRIMERKIDILIYHSSILWLDFVVILGLVLQSYFGLLIILRCSRVRQYFSDIQEQIQLRDVANLHIIFRMILTFVLLSHFCACLRRIFQPCEYVDSLSICMMMLATIGANYQDNSFFVMIVSAISMGLIGYFTLVIFEIVNQVLLNLQLENASKPNQRLRLVMQYYNRRGLSKQLQMRLKKYYEYRTEFDTTTEQEKQIWDNLQTDLKIKLSVNLYGKIIRNSNLFRHHFSVDFLNQLCTKLQYLQVEKNLDFLQSGQQCDKLIFIIEGEVLQIKKDQTITSITNGVIDEFLFLTQMQRVTSYKSSKDTKLAYIDFEDFYETLRGFKVDFERYAMLRENLMYNEEFKNRQVFCSNCRHRGHMLDNCPFISLVIPRQKVIHNYNINYPSERLRYFRNDSKRFNTKLNKNLISITAISFAIGQKYHRESDLTNEVMNKLQGTTFNYEDSLFVDMDDKTQRTFMDKQYTNYTRQTEQQLIMNSPQNTLQSNTINQNSVPPLKMETMNDRESSFYSKKQSTINSIKVNVIKSSVSSDHLLNEKLRLSNKKKVSNSSSTNQRNDRGGKLSYMSANPPQNPLQPQPIAQYPQMNQSTSIMQHSLNPTYSTVHQQFTQPMEENDVPYSSPLAIGHYQVRTRIDFWECDRINDYKYYFPSFNFDWVAARVNHKQQKDVTLSKTIQNFTVKYNTEKFLPNKQDLL